jgi:hypothetical protein
MCDVHSFPGKYSNPYEKPESRQDKNENKSVGVEATYCIFVYLFFKKLL